VRGALVDDEGNVVFFATPKGGALGVYDGAERLIVGVGAPAFGARVVDFALNPASINADGHLALRVALDDGREVIARADPPW
jgi:hypothetical protein